MRLPLKHINSYLDFLLDQMRQLSLNHVLPPVINLLQRCLVADVLVHVVHHWLTHHVIVSRLQDLQILKLCKKIFENVFCYRHIVLLTRLRLRWLLLIKVWSWRQELLHEVCSQTQIWHVYTSQVGGEVVVDTLLVASELWQLRDWALAGGGGVAVGPGSEGWESGGVSVGVQCQAGVVTARLFTGVGSAVDHGVRMVGGVQQCGAGALHQPAAGPHQISSLLQSVSRISVRGSSPLLDPRLGIIVDCPPGGLTSVFIRNLDKPLMKRQVVANWVLKHICSNIQSETKIITTFHPLEAVLSCLSEK